VRKHNFIPILASLAALALLAACQSGEDGSSEPQTAQERAQARWDLLVERDFAGAWAFHTPGFRETSTAEAWGGVMAQRPVRWTEAQVVDSACEGDRCTVFVDVTYEVPSAPNGLNSVRPTSEVEETWIRTGGKWWYVPEN
jgi:hypothetical protein